MNLADCAKMHLGSGSDGYRSECSLRMFIMVARRRGFRGAKYTMSDPTIKFIGPEFRISLICFKLVSLSPHSSGIACTRDDSFSNLFG